MEIKRFVFNPFRENTYVVWDDTNECIIIDAGNMVAGENRILKEFITAHNLKPQMAVNTHGHFDHTQGVQWLKEPPLTRPGQSAPESHCQKNHL